MNEQKDHLFMPNFWRRGAKMWLEVDFFNMIQSRSITFGPQSGNAIVFFAILKVLSGYTSYQWISYETTIQSIDIIINFLIKSFHLTNR